MKKTLLLLMLLSCTAGSKLKAQDSLYVLIANIPTTGYSRPGVICPKYSNFNIAPTASNLGLLGKVKTVNYQDGTIYEFNKNGQLTKHLKLFNSNPSTRTTLYTYNKENQHVTIEYSGTGNYTRNSKYTYTYGAQGVINQCYTNETDTTCSQITAEQIYNQRKAIKKNALGLISEIGSSKLEYDGRNRLVKITSPNGIETRKYNENNTLSTIKFIGDKKEINASFRYDPKGNWIRETATQVRAGRSSKMTDNLIRFKFDSKGNWTTMDINSDLSKNQTRTITYY